MEDVRIRRMEATDLPRVMEVEYSCYTMPWNESTFRGLLRRADADLFVAESNGRVVGHAVAWSVLDQGELGNLAVAPEWRRRGVARRLLDRVVERSLERRVRELFLEVRVSNIGAQALYRSERFREVGRRRNYYMEPLEDALVMRRDLDPDAPESSPLD